MIAPSGATKRALLLAAADFIRQHPDGADPALKTLLADACADAARGPLAVSRPGPSEPSEPSEPMTKQTELEGFGDPAADAKTLLKAGGMINVRPVTLKVYTFLMLRKGKAYSTASVEKGTRLPRRTVVSIMGKLSRRGIIKRTQYGHYTA